MDKDAVYKSAYPGKIHLKPYQAISPTRPEISQAGKTVLVVGGSTGIGRAIACAFVQASAAKVIVLGRRPGVLEQAVAELRAHIVAGSSTEVVGIICDATTRTQVDGLWDGLREGGTRVDVLVINSVSLTVAEPLLMTGTDKVWKMFQDNVCAPLHMTERFCKQPGHDNQKYLVNVSTASIHNWEASGHLRAYGLTKNSFACTLQTIARESPVDKMQIVNYHPGAVLTEGARSGGYTEDMLNWTDVDLPGQWAVWAASPEAKFLHGRFAWCNWDVEELATGEWRKKIDEDPFFLQVGVKGL